MEGSDPSQLFITDLTQATFTPGTPAGTWTAPSQVKTLEESVLSAGSTGLAVAQGTHTGVTTGEFGGDSLTALALPEPQAAALRNSAITFPAKSGMGGSRGSILTL